MELQTVLDRLEGKRILIIGDVILDEYVWGDTKRISPEAPVPILEAISQRVQLGGAANVAHNVAGLGGKAALIGIVGDDSQGTLLIDLLNEKKLIQQGFVSIKAVPQPPRLGSSPGFLKRVCQRISNLSALIGSQDNLSISVFRSSCLKQYFIAFHKRVPLFLRTTIREW